MESKKVAIVIPVYKTAINENETLSLMACDKQLSGYSTFIIGPKKINYKNYLNCFVNNKTVNIIKLNNHHFHSITSYNKLLMSLKFYKLFRSFKYILIYQTDAMVFRDELEAWCELNYDYIGAPWFSDDTSAKRFIGIGNGGFSLRRVESAIKVLSTHKRIYSIPVLWNKEKSIKYNLNGRIGSYLKILKALFYLGNNSHYLFNDYDDNEDIFWGERAKEIFTWYNIPSEEIAMKFAFETHPALLFEKNNRQLPFGCHAWEKYEPEFWNNYISHTLT